MNESEFSLFPSGLGIRQRIHLEDKAARQLRPVCCISQSACELMSLPWRCRVHGCSWCVGSQRFLRRPELRTFGWLSGRPWDEFPATWIDGVFRNSDKVQASLKPAAEAGIGPGPHMAWLSTHCEIYVPGQATSHINDMKTVTKARALVGQPWRIIVERWDKHKLKCYFRANWTPLTPCVPAPPPPTESGKAAVFSHNHMTYPCKDMCNVWHRRQPKIASEWSRAAYLQTPTACAFLD